MKGWYLLFLMAFVPYLSNGQCINSTPYLNVTSNNTGQIQEIGGCTYSTEYNTISGLLVGENYIFTATNQGVDKYVSITDASNVSIAHGPSPLIVNAITASTVRLHVSNSSACDGGSICHITTVQFLADCPTPVSLGITNLTTTTTSSTTKPMPTAPITGSTTTALSSTTTTLSTATTAPTTASMVSTTTTAPSTTPTTSSSPTAPTTSRRCRNRSASRSARPRGGDRL